jgi:NhaP-type Na+/H+ or K+/H+ antiporter
VSLGTGIIPLVVTILGLGVAAQLLADRLAVPSVLFLILAGIAVGPEGLGIVTLDAFGGPGPLSAIVGLSVGIIVFEGAFHLKLPKLRQTPREAFRLVTVGAAVALIGTVFLVILTTVVLEGGFARHIAQALGVLPMRVIIIGAGRVGRGLAERSPTTRHRHSQMSA